MNAREAFRYGFLRRLAEDGKTPEEIAQLTEKAASILGNVRDVAGMGLMAASIPIAATGAAAAGGGYLLGKHLGDSKLSPEEIRHEEYVGATDAATERLVKRMKKIEQQRRDQLAYKRPFGF